MTRAQLPKIGRDTVLFVAGLAGVIHETVVSKVDRPGLLVLFAGMLGLPAFLHRDEKRRNGDPPAPLVPPPPLAPEPKP